MTAWRVAEVRALPDWQLAVRFLDGLEGKVDLKGLIQAENSGVFGALKDMELFAQVGLQWGAVTWPNGLDLAPDAMHAEIRRNGIWTVA
jgi:hypothetical protein